MDVGAPTGCNRGLGRGDGRRRSDPRPAAGQHDAGEALRAVGEAVHGARGSSSRGRPPAAGSSAVRGRRRARVHDARADAGARPPRRNGRVPHLGRPLRVGVRGPQARRGPQGADRCPSTAALPSALRSGPRRRERGDRAAGARRRRSSKRGRAREPVLRDCPRAGFSHAARDPRKPRAGRGPARLSPRRRSAVERPHVGRDVLDPRRDARSRGGAPRSRPTDRGRADRAPCRARGRAARRRGGGGGAPLRRLPAAGGRGDARGCPSGRDRARPDTPLPALCGPEAVAGRRALRRELRDFDRPVGHDLVARADTSFRVGAKRRPRDRGPGSDVRHTRPPFGARGGNAPAAAAPSRASRG